MRQLARQRIQRGLPLCAKESGAPTGTAIGSVGLAIARFLLCTYEKYQQKYQQKEKHVVLISMC